MALVYQDIRVNSTD